MPNYGGIGGGGGGGGAVTSVFGRVGAVVAQAGDYGAATSNATLDGGGQVPNSQLGNAVTSVAAGVNTTIGGTANAPAVNAVQNDLSAPTGWWYQSLQRENVGSLAGGLLTSGLISFFKVLLVAGQILTQIGVYSGSTGATTPTHKFWSLYDSNFNALAATVDDGANAWGATTLRALAIGFTYAAGWNAAANYTIATSGLYYVGIMVAAATVPTLSAAATGSNASQIVPVTMGNDTVHAGQTTPQLSPAQLTNAGSPGGFFPWFLLG